MPLSTIFTDRVRPEKAARYRELIQEFAERAVEQNESFRWTAHETIFGAVNTVHYVATSEDYAGIAARGLVEELFPRVLGEQESAAHLQQIQDCILSQEVEVAIDRPELSYAPEEASPAQRPYALVTVLRPRPGHQEACEELLRKIAEAIPKANPTARMIAFQPVIGDLGRLWTVRPMANLAELDDLLPPPQLLEQAFGAAEGGLISRTGLDSIESVQRDTLLYRPEMSNPA